VLATLDAFVWSELGAAMPKAGGTYVFLREAYGPGKWGRLMSFLFVWQTFIQAPLSVASASIGFARYASYLHPLTKWEAKAISGGLVLVLIALLYRRITTIGKISVLLWAGVIGTMLWLIWGGMTHFDRKIAFDFPAGAFSFSSLWFAGLGSAMVSTVYSYWGYYNICHLGEEIKQHSNPFANLAQRALRRCQINGLKALIPDLEPPVNPLPHGARDQGGGYVFLRARDNMARSVTDMEGLAIRSYRESMGEILPADWEALEVRWARLRLPNGQIARSAWKEKPKGENLRISRNVQVNAFILIQII